MTLSPSSQLGATDRLIVLFHRINRLYEETASRTPGGGADPEETSYIEGVRVGDFVELLMAALQAMAQSSAPRATIIVGAGGTDGEVGVLALVVQVRDPAASLDKTVAPSLTQ